MNETILLILTSLNLIVLVIILIRTWPRSDKNELLNQFKSMRNESSEETQRIVRTFSDVLTQSSQTSNSVMDKRLEELTRLLKGTQENLQNTVTVSLHQIQQILANNTLETEQKLENIRLTIEKRLTSLQEENSKKLDEMRNTVDEKLQKTLEERISKSFNQVSTQLEQVYKGLGEMQNLAVGVGDLKKVLSNVKTRGILGEIQLGAILEQILGPEQYSTNIVTKKGSRNPVEFAVKLPGDENGPVYLPIDSKFPLEDYNLLNDAYDRGNKVEIELLAKVLESKIKVFAKDIHDKYISVPDTTDFGILFLPIEGLYAEVVRRGMVESLQRDYKIIIAGPTTMAALLNSLQMGFKTLAIQKRSGEVWNILAAVKTEFDSFGDVLALTQNRLEQAHSELDKLVGVRTRKIQSKLRTVTTLDENTKNSILEIESEEPIE